MKWKAVSRPRSDIFLAALLDTVRTGKALQVTGWRNDRIAWLYKFAKKRGLSLHTHRNGTALILWAERRPK
jgi:hypothetical protein